MRRRGIQLHTYPDLGLVKLTSDQGSYPCPCSFSGHLVGHLVHRVLHRSFGLIDLSLILETVVVGKVADRLLGPALLPHRCHPLHVPPVGIPIAVATSGTALLDQDGMQPSPVPVVARFVVPKIADRHGRIRWTSPNSCQRYPWVTASA